MTGVQTCALPICLVRQRINKRRDTYFGWLGLVVRHLTKPNPAQGKGATRHVARKTFPTQRRLVVGEGYRVRLYVPFGKAWYPYYMRRLSAEGPANVFFMLRNLFRR